MESILFASGYYQIKSLGCSNFGDIGCMGHISKTIPVHLEPGAIISMSDLNNTYSNQPDTINYLTPSPAYIDSGILINTRSS